MRGRFVLLLSASLLATTAVARGQSAADLETARLLFAQGNDLHDHGDVVGALAKFRAADALAHTPVTALELGKTHAELGHLVDARAVLVSVASIPVKPNESAKTTFARSEAAKLAAQLLPRIPTLTVTFEGASADARLELRIDDVTIDPQTIGQPRVVDPGVHTIVTAVEGGPSTTTTLTLAEGETRLLSVHVDRTPRPAPPIDVPRVDAPPPEKLPDARPPAPPPAPPKPATKHGPDAGLVVAVSLGGAALVSFVVMGVTGALAQGKASLVGTHCSETRCDEQGLAAASAGRTFATTANVMLALGSAFAVSALVVGLVTRPRAAPAAALAIVPTAGGAGATLSFTFE